MPNLIRHASLLSCSSLQHRIWSDLRNEMFAQVCREVSKAFVTQSLDCANDSCGVHVVTPGHFARRQKEGFFVTVQDRSNQLAPAAAQLRLCEAYLERRRCRFTLISALTIRLIPGRHVLLPVSLCWICCSLCRRLIRPRPV